MSNVVSLADFIRSQFADAVPEGGEEKNIIDTIEKVLDEYFSTKDLRQKTELTINEILFLTKLRIYQQLLEDLFDHDPHYIKYLRDEFMSLKVSHDRKGRREITNIFSALLTQEKKEEEDEMNTLKKLFQMKTD